MARPARAGDGLREAARDVRLVAHDPRLGPEQVHARADVVERHGDQREAQHRPTSARGAGTLDAIAPPSRAQPTPATTQAKPPGAIR